MGEPKPGWAGPVVAVAVTALAVWVADRTGLLLVLFASYGGP